MCANALKEFQAQRCMLCVMCWFWVAVRNKDKVSLALFRQQHQHQQLRRRRLNYGYQRKTHTHTKSIGTHRAVKRSKIKVYMLHLEKRGKKE